MMSMLYAKLDYGACRIALLARKRPASKQAKKSTGNLRVWVVYMSLLKADKVIQLGKEPAFYKITSLHLALCHLQLTVTTNLVSYWLKPNPILVQVHLRIYTRWH